jgi:hypothetical protein
MKKVIWCAVVVLVVLSLSLFALSCGGATAPPAGEEPGTSQEESTPAEEPKEEEATATAISHDLGGRENCLMCHETGLGDADPIPADHAGRANETCTTCHQPE